MCKHFVSWSSRARTTCIPWLSIAGLASLWYFCCTTSQMSWVQISISVAISTPSTGWACWSSLICLALVLVLLAASVLPLTSPLVLPRHAVYWERIIKGNQKGMSCCTWYKCSSTDFLCCTLYLCIAVATLVSQILSFMTPFRHQRWVTCMPGGGAGINTCMHLLLHFITLVVGDGAALASFPVQFLPAIFE